MKPENEALVSKQQEIFSFRDLEDSTISTYVSYLVQFIEWFEAELPDKSVRDVTWPEIRSLDNIFTSVAKGSLLTDAIAEHTNGKFSSLGNFENTFKNASGDSLDFVRKLLNARGTDGAGSILYSLNTSEADAFAPDTLISTSATYVINTDNTEYTNKYGSGHIFLPSGMTAGRDGKGNGFKIQAGAEKDQYIYIIQYNISAKSLLGALPINVRDDYQDSVPDEGVKLRDERTRSNAIEIIKNADRKVSLVRSYYGATQNRLEHTIKNLDNIVENTTSAESLIRDTDMAAEMVSFSNSNILSQAGQSLLAQSNQSKQGLLSLLTKHSKHSNVIANSDKNHPIEEKCKIYLT